MARGHNKRKTSPVHRFGLTHGREGVPKIIRENTEQFFATDTKRKSKMVSASRPVIITELQQQHQQEQTKKNDKEKKNLLPTLTSKPLTSSMILPPIRTSSSKRPKPISSASVCDYQTNFLPYIQSSSMSLRSPSPEIKSPPLELKSPTLELKSSTLPLPSKGQFRHGSPVDQDLFRKAYDRALSVARSRLLFHDPYSLTRASATHGILYSYYDHTPMCIFSRGVACNHRQDKTYKQDQILKGNISRKKIFNDVIVENYIRLKK